MRQGIGKNTLWVYYWPDGYVLRKGKSGGAIIRYYGLNGREEAKKVFTALGFVLNHDLAKADEFAILERES
jgi:hypothetical protein